MFRVVINNYYANDYMDYCIVVERNEDMPEYDVKELITAVQFLFEECIDECSNPTMDSLAAVLVRHYGFHVCEKTGIESDIRKVLAHQELYGDSVFPLEINDISYMYMDMFSDREHFCGPGHPDRLWKKWIPDKLRSSILELLEPDL